MRAGEKEKGKAALERFRALKAAEEEDTEDGTSEAPVITEADIVLFSSETTVKSAVENGLINQIENSVADIKLLKHASEEERSDAVINAQLIADDAALLLEALPEGFITAITQNVFDLWTSPAVHALKVQFPHPTARSRNRARCCCAV